MYRSLMVLLLWLWSFLGMVYVSDDTEGQDQDSSSDEQLD